MNGGAGVIPLLLVVILLSFQRTAQISAASSSSAKSSKLFPDIYCGLDSCYDVLQVQLNATVPEIKKAFRKLSLIYHPDKTGGDSKSMEMFSKISVAHETLINEESRKDYNYYLEHPDNYYYTKFNYIRRMYAPKSDWRIIVALIIAVTMTLQYHYKKYQYNLMREQIRSHPKIKSQAKSIAVERTFGSSAKAPKKMSATDIESLKIAEEDALEAFVKEHITLELPHFFNLYPAPISSAIKHWVSWHIRYTIMKQEYDQDAVMYLTCEALKLNERRFLNEFPESLRTSALNRKLWIKENLDKWNEERLEEFKTKHPGAYKKSLREKRRGVQQYDYDDY